MRVLLVDDHPVVREALCAVLQSEPDIEVVGKAVNGRHAVELTRALQPEVVVMDVRMPEKDGIATTRLVRTEFPQVCVIGLSVGPDPKDAAAIREAGAATCVDKGDPQAVITAIRQCVCSTSRPSPSCPPPPLGRCATSTNRPL
jgi:DNA-binding NarL/FixJ family response regulator